MGIGDVDLFYCWRDGVQLAVTMLIQVRLQDDFATLADAAYSVLDRSCEAPLVQAGDRDQIDGSFRD